MEQPLKISVTRISAFNGHTGSIFAMVLSADEQLLYSGGDDGILAIWDLNEASDQAQALLRTPSSIYSLLPLPELGLMAAGTSDGTLYIVDLDTRQVVHTYRPGKEAVYGLWFDPELQRLWVLHGQGMLSVLEVKDWNPLYYARLCEENLRSVAQVGDTLWIGAGDGKIYALDRRTGEIKRSWVAHDNTVFCLAADGQRGMLYSGGRDAYLKSWSMVEQTTEWSLPAHNFTINDLVLSPEKNILVTASRDRTLKVWEPLSGTLLKVVDWERNQGHRHSVNRLQWRNSDNSLFSCSDDKTIIRWKLEITPA